MASGGVSLGGLGLIAAGSLLTWSAVNDPDGGPIQALRDIASGKTPTPGVQQVTAPLTGVGVAGGAAGAINQLSPAGGNRLPSGEGLPAGVRGRVVAVAQTYLGVMYRLGGANRTGIDCSGLVLVAYRDGAGIALPHLATAQMARGQRIPREQVQPGDLVGWGVPGNYPHIALAVSYDQVIVASTWGKPVMYQTLWEKKVSGFGYPDIVRIVAPAPPGQQPQ